MAKVHITQCLCPNRHCIAALAWEESDQTSAESSQASLKNAIDEAIEQKSLNPWCGLCNSTEFHYEDALTPFQSWQEAVPLLRQAERDALTTKQHYDALRN